MNWVLELFVVLALIVANGCFAMAELAIVSSRTTRLEAMSKKGDKGALAAIKIAEDPSDFLSAVQIGITLIGILTGAFSGATMAVYLAPLFRAFSLTAKFADSISFIFVISVVTYLSLIIGELVPKKIAINNPEKIASSIARPITVFVVLFKPLVKFLSYSSAKVFSLLNLKEHDKSQITEEEFLSVLDDGARSGVVELAEIDMMKNILESNDMRISSIMLPRNMIVWLDLEDSLEKNIELIKETGFSVYPVAKHDLDELEGIMFSRDLVSYLGSDEEIDLKKFVRKPTFVQENMGVLKVLDVCSEGNSNTALVVDEFGGIAGMIKDHDIVRCITGDLVKLSRKQGSIDQILQIRDNSWLFDGLLHISEFKDFMDVEVLPDEEKYRFDTLGGFIVALFGHIPNVGEKINWNDYQIEIISMDNSRIAKVMFTK